MEKLIYLVWAEGDAPDAVRARLLEDAAPRLVALGARALTLDLADVGDLDGSVPIRSGAAAPLATASIWVDSVDQRPALERELEAAGGRLAGYLVTESVPRDFDRRTWPDGERSPGVKLVTAFEKPARLSMEEFLERWHGSHTPLALSVHPLWRYVRNVVARPLTQRAPALAGIVDEHFRTLEDLTDPMRFYGAAGSVERMRANQRRIVEDAGGFLDLEQTQSWVMREHILKS